MTETFSLTREELRRIEVMSRVDSGLLTASEAAKLLELSVRQVRRILAAYRKEGPAALAHGNRGRKPAHAIPVETRKRVVELTKSKYVDYNHQHLSEELESDGIVISRPSVRRILGEVGLVSPKKRRRPKHRSRRERYPQEGMLVQIDGSPHDWLEDRGPRLTLHAAIDDATGKILGACFREQEDAAGYLELLRQVVLRYGIPLALYHDRHGIFVQNPKAAESRETIEEQLAGVREPTQFGRVLVELGIRSIQANSPQAKGRVERLFQTTQDRLTKALRKVGAATLGEANAVLAGPNGSTDGSTGGFIEEFNSRFGVPAASAELAYRKVPEGFRPEEVFCFKYLRVVAHDNTVGFHKQSLQLLADDRRTSFAKLKVEVHERLDQSIGVYQDGRLLASVEAPKEPKELRTRSGPRPSPRPSGPREHKSAGGSSLPETKTESSPSPDSVKAEAKPEGRSPEERTPGETHREIEQSNDLSKSDGAAMNGESRPKDEESDCRKAVASHVDKWTGERIARPATPSSSHPWRTISQKLKDQLARSS
jgi:transposase